jgi:hypothetical protein
VVVDVADAPAPDDDELDDELDVGVDVLHVPMVAFVELHVCDAGHPLPPWPRQPATQAFLAASQTRADVLSPQSPSTAHPQVSPARQTPPAADGEQFCVWLAVHSTQWSTESQT